MRVAEKTASAVPPPKVHFGGSFSVSSRRIASRSRPCQSEVGHLVDPVDVPAINHPPIARRPVEVLEADHASQDDVVDRLFGDLVEERSEEHTSELQSLMRISYAVFCLKKKKTTTTT